MNQVAIKYPGCSRVENGMSKVERILRGSLTPASDLLYYVERGTLMENIAVEVFRMLCQSVDIDSAARFEQDDMTRRPPYTVSAS